MLSLGAALNKLQNTPSPPWLSTPIYTKFLQAISPSAQVNELSQIQLELWEYLHCQGESSDSLKLCLGYWNSQRIRTTINALLFGGASIEQIDAGTRLGVEPLTYFSELFCDLNVFNQSKLLLSDYVSHFPEIKDGDKEEKTLYGLAIDYGWEWVLWKITKGLDGHIDSAKALDVLSNSAFWKAMEATAYGLNSRESAEGRHYMKLAADIALDKHRSKMGSFNSVKELQIRLTSLKESQYSETSSIATDTMPDIEELLYSSKEEA
jgi:hypothetical protein